MSHAQTPAAPAAGRTFEISATRRIAAPPEAVYGVFADYREAYPRILPLSFSVGLDVVEGGHGMGTVIDVSGKFAWRGGDREKGA